MSRKILKGFTLIELLVVVAIIGTLSTIGVVAYSKYTSMAQIKAIKAQNKEMHDFIKTNMLMQCIYYFMYYGTEYWIFCFNSSKRNNFLRSARQSPGIKGKYREEKPWSIQDMQKNHPRPVWQAQV